MSVSDSRGGGLIGSLSLELRNLVKTFADVRALDDVSLDVAPGELVSILGSSGSGKSTLLRAVAGLERAGGTVAIGGRTVDALPPKERGVAFVFQSYALYPHMNVGANLAAPLVMQTLPATDRLPVIGPFLPGARERRALIARKVEATAGLLQIEGLLRRKPSQLSGGQRQRVALGRALIREPKLFLLDEPLANLDAGLRQQTRSELRALQQRLRTTTLFVTHDQSEAMAISDRIAVMFAGRIRQFATPDELFRNPVDLDVARFLSQPVLNVWPAHAEGHGAVRTTGGTVPVSTAAPGEGVLAFRPQNASLLPVDSDADGTLPGTVRSSEHGGADAYVALALDGASLTCTVRVASAELPRWRPGAPARLRVDPDSAWFFRSTAQAAAMRAALGEAA